MEVDLAVLADAANQTKDGKLNILGVFDRFTLGPDFPAASPTFALVVRILVHPSEAGEHTLVLRLADADGQEVAKLEGGFKARPSKASAKPMRVPIILGAQLSFPKPDDYVFDVLIDGRWERSIPLEVAQRQNSG